MALGRAPPVWVEHSCPTQLTLVLLLVQARSSVGALLSDPLEVLLLRDLGWGSRCDDRAARGQALRGVR
jgi:hypothetical protein